MIGPPDDRRGGFTPQLGLRVAVAGSVALALFAIVFFRLWFLQVLSTNQYANAATANKIVSSPIAAPRGDILDRDGNVLVGSQLAFDVEVEPASMPTKLDTLNIIHVPANNQAVYRKLDKVLGISDHRAKCSVDNPEHPQTRITVQLAKIPCEVAQQYQTAPYDNAIVGRDVTRAVQNYVEERQNLYPGITVEPVHQRSYPEAKAEGDFTLAAQVLGVVGPITANVLGIKSDTVTQQDVDHSRFKGLQLSAAIGQSGLEYQYDSELRGTDGQQRVLHNAFGEFEGYLAPKEPVPGETLKTTIDSKLQVVGERALQTAVSDNPPSDGGAFVAMDPDNGQIYAMGSNPSYNPEIFTKPIPPSVYSQQFTSKDINPQEDQATQSVGPTGSTFKVITAVAALESKVWTTTESYDDTGQFCESGGQCLQNSGHAAYGVVDLVKAIQVSDDIFFYHLGSLMNNPGINGGALQKWAGKFGIGRSTGVDLPGSAPGQVESPREVARLVKEQAECDAGKGRYKGYPKSDCNIAIPGTAWTIGDNVNAAVGQGDDQVSPLQLAVVYSALANGGKIITPHLGEDIQTGDGQILQKINPGIRRNLHINPSYLSTILAGLRAAASSGTSGDVMGDFGEPVYGKTGTAQYFDAEHNETDYAWYACFVPKTATSKPITVIVTVRKGGFGDVAAAPVARQILSQWFFNKPGPFKTGSSSDT